MSNELKPVILASKDRKGTLTLEWINSEMIQGPVIELYVIPPGYHIVAIDPKQQIHDTLDRHNDKVREGL